MWSGDFFFGIFVWLFGLLLQLFDLILQMLDDIHLCLLIHVQFYLLQELFEVRLFLSFLWWLNRHLIFCIRNMWLFFLFGLWRLNGLCFLCDVASLSFWLWLAGFDGSLLFGSLFLIDFSMLNRFLLGQRHYWLGLLTDYCLLWWLDLLFLWKFLLFSLFSIDYLIFIYGLTNYRCLFDSRCVFLRRIVDAFFSCCFLVYFDGCLSLLILFLIFPILLCNSLFGDFLL